RSRGVERTDSLDAALNRLTRDEFHRVEIGIHILAEMKNGRHVWMAEPGGRARLPHKSLARNLAVKVSPVNDLQRHGTAQIRVEGLVRDAHCAATELVERAIIASQNLVVMKFLDLSHLGRSLCATTPGRRTGLTSC